MSLITASRLTAERWTFSVRLRWRGVRSVASSSSAMPSTPFIGVRISWLMLARNSDFARLAASAASRARTNSWLIVSSLVAVAVSASVRERTLSSSTVAAWNSENAPPCRLVLRSTRSISFWLILVSRATSRSSSATRAAGSAGADGSAVTRDLRRSRRR